MFSIGFIIQQRTVSHRDHSSIGINGKTTAGIIRHCEGMNIRPVIRNNERTHFSAITGILNHLGGNIRPAKHNNLGRIIDTVDLDSNLLIHSATAAIVHCDSVGLGQHLVCAQVSNIFIRHTEGPAHLTRGGVADARGKCAQVTGSVGGNTDSLDIVKIHTGNGEGATVRQGSGVPVSTAFGHLANNISGRRIVVSASTRST